MTYAHYPWNTHERHAEDENRQNRVPALGADGVVR